MFLDRNDAGKKLAKALKKYKDENVIVLAIPRGGVEIGFEVAEYLHAEFSIIVSRKLPLPHNPEAGFGAVAEDGSTFIFNDAGRWLSESEIEGIVAEQRQVVKRRIRDLRNNEPFPNIVHRTIILVDDGIAMGSTMRVSISMCKNEKASKIVVAVPVTSRQVKQEMEQLADELTVLETPRNFRAVAQVYQNWHDVTDEEVIQILSRPK